MDALEAAARRGARVEVRLEGRPFPDVRRGIERHNEHVVEELRHCGASARLVDRNGRVPLHAKAARIDGTLYVDDVNFAERRGDRLEIETESIGGTKIYGDLCRRARAGARPRLLVSHGALTTKERRWLRRLEQSGVDVRACNANEKFAFAGDRAWIGSANATSLYPKTQTIDWDLTTHSRAVVARLRATFETRWQHARELNA